MTTVLHPLHICAVHNVRFATPLAWRPPAQTTLNLFPFYIIILYLTRTRWRFTLDG